MVKQFLILIVAFYFCNKVYSQLDDSLIENKLQDIKSDTLTYVLKEYKIDSCFYGLLSEIILKEKESALYYEGKIAYRFSIIDTINCFVIIKPILLEQRENIKSDKGYFTYKNRTFFCKGKMESQFIKITNNQTKFICTERRKNELPIYLEGDRPPNITYIECKYDKIKVYYNWLYINE